MNTESQETITSLITKHGTWRVTKRGDRLSFIDPHGIVRAECHDNPAEICKTVLLAHAGWDETSRELRSVENTTFAMDQLIDEQRCEVIRSFCTGCGRKQPHDRPCQCQNDE